MDLDPVLKAGIAHLWFVTIHPFEDGNGRIARAIADMQLARADGSRERFYSMSVQIHQERNAYYDVLEKTQKNTYVTKAGLPAARPAKGGRQAGIDITAWLEWFLACLNRALDTTESTLAGVFKKRAFGNLIQPDPLTSGSES